MGCPCWVRRASIWSKCTWMAPFVRSPLMTISPLSRFLHCDTPLQHICMYCNTPMQHIDDYLLVVKARALRHTAATHFNTLQHTDATHWWLSPHWQSPCTATHCCNTFQHTATHRCNTQMTISSLCTATTCNTLQHIAIYHNPLQHIAISPLSRSSLQHTATHCNTLQHIAIHHNPLQHIAISPLSRSLQCLRTLVRSRGRVSVCVSGRKKEREREDRRMGEQRSGARLNESWHTRERLNNAV